MPNFTEPELRQRYCEAMGSDLGEVFHQLMQEAAWLHLKWNEYIALFANATRVNQLNRAAPGFFRMVEETWSDDLILHICRMTDKGNDVLTVRLIPKLVTVALRDEVNSRLRRLTAAVDFARDWRDRRIAHRNIALALDRSAEPLSVADKAAFTGAIEAIDELLHFVDHHFTNAERVMYDHLDTLGGAQSVLDIVERGLRDRDRQFTLPPPGSPY
jgi:AbiU2